MIKKISLITTIINSLMEAGLLVFEVTCIIAMCELSDDLADLQLATKGSQDGLDTLLNLFLTPLGALGVLLLYLLILFMTMAIAIFLPSVVIGIVAYARNKAEDEDTYRKLFKTDAIAKIICNGIVALFLVGSVRGLDEYKLLLMAIPSIAVCALSVYQLVLYGGNKQ